MKLTAVFGALLAGLAAAFGCAGPSPSHRDEADNEVTKQIVSGTRELNPLIVAQMPLVEAAGKIRQLAWEKHFTNFTGIRLDDDSRAVVLYWKGPLPPAMAGLVEDLRADVRIEVIAVPYSQDELRQEAKRLVQLDLEEMGVNVTEAGPLRDFSGLRVAVENADQLDRARQIIQSPMRLEFTVSSKAVPLSSP